MLETLTVLEQSILKAKRMTGAQVEGLAALGIPSLCARWIRGGSPSSRARMRSSAR
jgi:hypothetical protein